MTNHPTLFNSDDYRPHRDPTTGIEFTPCDRRVDPVEQPRLSRQCRLILDRLRRGRATNLELGRLALKYTGRISDLRKAGYNVVVVKRDRVSGEVWYELKEQRDD